MILRQKMEKLMGIWYEDNRIISCPEEDCKDRGHYEECYSKELNYCPIEQERYVLSDN